MSDLDLTAISMIICSVSAGCLMGIMFELGNYRNAIKQAIEDTEEHNIKLKKTIRDSEDRIVEVQERIDNLEMLVMSKR